MSTKSLTCRQRATDAYTIVEVLVAAGILVIGIMAAASMALSMVAQEEANARVSRALNMQEQAARLYQLGLEPAGIVAILPEEPDVTVEFTTDAPAVGGVGTMERATCSVMFTTGTGANMSDPDDVAIRTSDIVVLRSSIR